MLGQCGTAAAKKYRWEILGAMAIYVVFLLVSVHWLKHNPAAPWKYAIAVLPIFPLLLVPMSVIRCLRELDELQRKIQLEALAFAFTATAIVTLTYGFLENAGLPNQSWVWVWPIMGVFWSIGQAVARQRYK
jgi:hypothetical protein